MYLDTHKNYGIHVGPSDGYFSRLNQFSGVHLIILIFAAYALLESMKIKQYK